MASLSRASAAKNRTEVGSAVPPDVVAVRADSLDLVDSAFRVESSVFRACGYGEMPGELDAQSTFYVAVPEGSDEVVGVLRMVESGEVSLPLMDLPREGAWARRLADSGGLHMVEYGALAVPSASQAQYGQRVAKVLYRAGWRHTVRSGCDYSGMVMEPRRAQAMARWHGLAFDQGGPTRYYMGGEVAAHFAAPQVLLARLGRVNPALHDFMVDGMHLSSFEPSPDPSLEVVNEH